MKLNKKKELVARAMGIGKARIMFNVNRLNEIKDSLTHQDIMVLIKDGAIKIRDIKGRRKIVNKKRRRGQGKIKKRIKEKNRYGKLARKLRKYLGQLKRKGITSSSERASLRKDIRSKKFKNIMQLKARIKGVKK